MDRTRRAFLASVASGSVPLAGCGGVVGGRNEPVRILAAGSLQAPLAEGLATTVSTPVAVEAQGSAAAARLVSQGKRNPDVVALADTTLFADLLDSPWHAAFATNDLVVAHADTPGGRRVATADEWFEPIQAGSAGFGRTDPELDPLGYRTLFALQLGADYYDRSDLDKTLLRHDQVYPETALSAQFETGAIDAAVLYGSMATQHGLEAIDLPAAIDLSSPERADDYAAASYDLRDGTTVRGDVIEYAATLRRRTPATESVFETLVSGRYLEEYGFGRPDRYPRFTDNAPESLA